MTNKMVVSVFVLMLSAGCATSGTASDSAGSEKQVSDVLRSSDEKKAPNQYGWDDSNCAHIMADGHCAHKTGVNTKETIAPQSPNAGGSDSSNCAHIMADGTCAHEM